MVDTRTLSLEESALVRVVEETAIDRDRIYTLYHNGGCAIYLRGATPQDENEVFISDTFDEAAGLTIAFLKGKLAADAGNPRRANRASRKRMDAQIKQQKKGRGRPS